jgi:hypothetical protein
MLMVHEWPTAIAGLRLPYASQALVKRWHLRAIDGIKVIALFEFGRMGRSPRAGAERLNPDVQFASPCRWARSVAHSPETASSLSDVERLC